MPILPIKKHETDCLRRHSSHNNSSERPQTIMQDEPSTILQQLGYSKMSGQATKREEIASLLVKLSGDARPFVRIELMGIELIGLLDSGAARTVLGIGANKIIRALNLKLEPASVNLKTAAGEDLDVVGCTEIPITFNGTTKILPVLVAPKLNRRCVLGYDFWLKFGIRPTFRDQTIAALDDGAHGGLEEEEEALTQEQVKKLEEVQKLFLIAEPGKLSMTHLMEHSIEIKDEYKNGNPVRKNPYPWSPEIQRKIHQAVDMMLREEIIEPSSSDWSLPVVPVTKRDSQDVRLCLDARKLNERTKRDAYPLPHQNRILSHLGPVKYLSTIDLSQAFLQIPLNVNSRKYTAFSIPGRGLFQFTRLPFGLVNSPATLSKLMDRVLGHGALEPAIFVYLDDIVVASRTFEDHIRKLRDLANRLREANLCINIKKSKFCCQELPYLGYILSQEGLRPNPDRVQAIMGYQVPKSVRQLRRFLGMVNYYRRFIANFSELTSTLTDLLKNKPKRVEWNMAADNAFREIKERLISAPVMANPNFTLPFTVQTDASDNAIAGVLTQVHNGEEKVIAYHSEKLRGAELNYHAAEKEGLAALRCIEKFRGYIEGTKFTLVTDSAALTFIMRAKWRSSSRLSRWSITLQQFDLEIRHRKGKENIVPDALSRSLESLDAEPEDGWYKKLFVGVSSDPEKYVDFKIVDNKLYKFIASKADTMDYHFEWKHCVPASLRTQIIRNEHDGNLHIGYEKCVEKIKRSYYWPRMAADIKKHISKCESCKANKHPTVSTAPQMGNQRVATKPFQIICMDYIQSLPRSKHGNAHLLVVMDIFSKYCLLAPVKKISAVNLCKILEEQWFRKLSTPQIVITDNATTFRSREFQNLMANYDIKHWASARHRSQANPAERLNRTINAMIRTYVKDDQKLWDSKISEIEFILNNTIHSCTKFSPHCVLYGHEIITKGSQHKLETNKELDDVERMDRLRGVSRKMYDLVTAQLLKTHDDTKKRYDLRHKRYSPMFDIGQRIYKRSFRLSSAGNRFNAKLGPQYTPCVVIAKKGTSSYEVADLMGKSLGIFSAADLKA